MIRLLILLSVAMLPLYLWESGGLQISHVILILAAALFLFRNNVKLGNAEAILVALVIVVVLREIIWAVSSGEANALLQVLYVAFNLVVFNVIRRWASDPSHVWALRTGLFLAMVVAIGGIYIKGFGLTIDAEGGRAVGTFNNPNQLGYFAICSFAIAVLMYLRGQINVALLSVFFLGSLFLAVASLSKAAMISIAFTGLMTGYSLSRSKASFLIGTLFAATLLIGVTYAFQSGYFDDLKMVSRLRGIGSQSDDSFAGRGYNIFSDASGFQLLFGFGYQGVREVLGHEVHSTLVSYFAAYGALGGTLFLAFHLLWVKRLIRYEGLLALFVVAFSPLLYGITHNGGRFTIYWILLGLSFAIPSRKEAQLKGEPSPFRNKGIVRVGNGHV